MKTVYSSFPVWAAGMLLVVLCGCAGRIASMNADGMEQVRTRAAFDFGCDEASVNVTPLTTGASTSGPDRYHRDLVIEYGAVGCGKRTSFTRLDNGQWIRGGEITSD